MTKTTSIAISAALAVVAHGAFAEPATYDTAQDAFEAAVAAIAGSDRDAILTVFGPEAEDLIYSGDEREDRVNKLALTILYREGFRLIPNEDDSITVALGLEDWPFPIPIVRSDSGWQFDIEAGREEIDAREIGANELDVIDLLDAYGDLQAAFRLVDVDGDGVMEFARHIISSDEARDGLFWPDEDSPIGELVAQANFDGFSDGNTDLAPVPYLGYYYRILTGQGPDAPGGARDYMSGEDMTGGHALIAAPAEYGVTGVSSFLVGENGVIFEADLGEGTLDAVAAIEVYNPDEVWTPVD